MSQETVARGGRDWDKHIPYVLFAYRASQQESTQESPFFLLHGRDPRLPRDMALCSAKNRGKMNLKEYRICQNFCWESPKTTEDIFEKQDHQILQLVKEYFYWSRPEIGQTDLIVLWR